MFLCIQRLSSLTLLTFTAAMASACIGSPDGEIKDFNVIIASPGADMGQDDSGSPEHPADEDNTDPEHTEEEDVTPETEVTPEPEDDDVTPETEDGDVTPEPEDDDVTPEPEDDDVTPETEATPEVDDEGEITDPEIEEELAAPMLYTGSLVMDIVIFRTDDSITDPVVTSCETEVEFIVDPSAEVEVSWDGSCFLEGEINVIYLSMEGSIDPEGLIEGTVEISLNGQTTETHWMGSMDEEELEGDFETTWAYLPMIAVDLDAEFIAAS